MKISSHRGLARIALTCLGFLIAFPASTQTGLDLFNTSPRGLTDIRTVKTPAVPATPTVPTLPTSPTLPGTSNPSGTAGLTGRTGSPEGTGASLPPNPSATSQPIVFGSQMFNGRFGSEPFSGFNAEYQIATGDRISVRMWGAFPFESTQPVDAQGNIFVPNVGPVHLLGVRNGDLNRQVETQVKKVFRSNVGVYATLEAAQPVKIYVTGFVRAPGLYAGLSSDSVLHYLDKAGGIDPDRGSFLLVDVLRSGRVRASFNLYDFLLNGHIEPVQLQDGDIVIVRGRRHTVRVSGEVLNPYIFEFESESIPAARLLGMARPRPSATHLSVVRKVGAETRSEYISIKDAEGVTIGDGDEVTVTADKYPGTILVRVEGSHLGQKTLVLPYGSRFRDVMDRIRPAPQSNLQAVQLFRKSVADRQKEMIEISLRSLETYALTARSSTSEEAALRSHEADLILQFIDRARMVQPRGQIILSDGGSPSETLLEDGDVIQIPAVSNLVLVSGEVTFPNALVFDPRASFDDYIQRAGGYTQGSDREKVLVVRQDGSVSDAAQATLKAGDEIMVLPKIDTKRVEITRGITQIIYQIAVSAKVLFGL